MLLMEVVEKETLALALTLSETIKQMSKGKAPGPDGIPAEIYKQCVYHTARHFTWLFRNIWEQENASLVHLYKRKHDRANCDNHYDIFLGKLLHGLY